MQSATFTAEEDPTGKLAEQYAKPFLGYGEKWSEGTLAYVAKFNTTNSFDREKKFVTVEGHTVPKSVVTLKCTIECPSCTNKWTRTSQFAASFMLDHLIECRPPAS